MGKIKTGRDLYIQRGDTLALVMRPYVGDITARQDLWFTLKKNFADPDAAAMVQIQETAGLVYINGGVATVPSNGSISVPAAASGNVVVLLAADESAKLTSCEGFWFYDIQVEWSTGIETLIQGRALVSPDVTRTVGNEGAGNYVLWPNGAPVLWPS